MPLRILTINLFNGRADARSFAAALDKHVPDVVAVQELSDNAAEVLANWGTHRLLDPRDDTTGMGVTASATALFSRPEFPNRHPINARIDGAQWGFPAGIDLINAHLVNPIARPMLASKRLRHAEMLSLERLLNADRVESLRVVVGDLNSSPAWPLYRHLGRIASDAATEAGTAKRTWGPTPRSPRLLRIDHVFIQGARCTTTQLVDVRGTDHRGLLVTLEPLR